MKKTFLALALLGATSALANMPTKIMCSGTGTTMTMNMMEQDNGDGMMEMATSMMINGQEFPMERVDMTPTPMGMMYTVKTDYVPDLRSNFMTFVMPMVNIMPGRGNVDFMGVLYSHSKKTSIMGPGIIHGIIDTVSGATMMECTAMDMDMDEMP